MTCVALIPIKPRTAGKSRLSEHLDDTSRLDLVRKMLRNVLDAAARAPEVDRLVVMSNERDEVPPHIDLVADPCSDFNAALDELRTKLSRDDATCLVILPADLPLLSPDDVSRLCRGAQRTGCAIAPDRHRSGTNGLALDAGMQFRFRFGAQSFVRHCSQARIHGLEPQIVETPSLGLDIDSRSDLDILFAPFAQKAQAS